MSTINEYRDKKAETDYPIDTTTELFPNTEMHQIMSTNDKNWGLQSGFKIGFDAAMDLRLPEKYLQWTGYNCFQTDEGWMISGAGMITFSSSEMYDFWLNNVFNVQECDARMMTKDQMPGQKK